MNSAITWPAWATNTTCRTWPTRPGSCRVSNRGSRTLRRCSIRCPEVEGPGRPRHADTNTLGERSVRRPPRVPNREAPQPAAAGEGNEPTPTTRRPSRAPSQPAALRRPRSCKPVRTPVASARSKEQATKPKDSTVRPWTALCSAATRSASAPCAGAPSSGPSTSRSATESAERNQHHAASISSDLPCRLCLVWRPRHHWRRNRIPDSHRPPTDPAQQYAPRATRWSGLTSSTEDGRPDRRPMDVRARVCPQ